MPRISGTYDAGRPLLCYGAILPPSGPVPKSFVPCWTLIDTGATITSLSKRHVAVLNMQPIRKSPIRGVGGTKLHDVFQFRIAFPPQNWAILPRENPAALIVREEPIQGCDFEGAGDFDIILGMDIISTGCLTVRADKTFTFEFAEPNQ
jgi:hypothetical protein